MAVIFEPIRQLMTPQNTAVDPSVDNDFTFVVNGGTCVAYRYRVFDVNNNLVVTPSTGRVDLGATVFNGATVTETVTAGGLIAGNEYRYQFDAYGNDLTVSSIDLGTDILTVANHNLNSGDIVYIQSTATLPTGTSAFTIYYIGRISANELALYETYEAAKIDGTKVNITGAGSGTITISNIAISPQVKFFANSTPSLVLTGGTLTEQSEEFVPVYTQAESILVISFNAYLYDSNGNLEDESGEIFSSDVRYTFTGLRSGFSYKVQFTTTNARSQTSDTGLVDFDVTYAAPSIGIQPSVTNQENRSSVLLEWDDIVQIVGSITGSSSYVPDFMSTGNTALNITSGSLLEFTGLVIDNDQTLAFIWYPDTTGYSGDIVKLENTTSGDYLTVAYDGSKFYRDINGVIFNEPPQALVANQVYLIAITSQKLFIVDFTTV
jgi:hypothetical protein